MRGIEIWRSGGEPSHAEFLDAPAVVCLCYVALSEWHLGETPSCQATITEAISLANALNDMNALAIALFFACWLAHFAGRPDEVKRLASELTELSTRQSFQFWLAAGRVLRGWARSACADITEGILWMVDGIEDFRANGATLCVPYYLALKAEGLHLVDHTSEALEAIGEAEVLVQIVLSVCFCLARRLCRF
jgi:hypothetical protein